MSGSVGLSATPKERAIYVVRVPATSANLGPGFDAIGLALQLYNQFTFEERSANDVALQIEAYGSGREGIPLDETNLAYMAARRVFDAVEYRPASLRIAIECNLPWSSGLGSSSTAIVGGMLGANAIAGSPLDREELLRMATLMEGHPDNVMPAICGGLTVGVLDGEELVTEKVELPPLRVIVVTPSFSMPTEEARDLLPEMISREDAVFNIGRSALLLRALATGSFGKLRIAIQDRLHQPHRLKLIPGFEQAMAAAYGNGADGVALSGAGPSMIAFAHENHEAIAKVIVAEFQKFHTASRHWVLSVDNDGATITESVTVVDGAAPATFIAEF